MSAEIEIARQWIAKAKNDLLNADNNLKAEQIPVDTICFHYQQAAEKLLKAYLVAKGRPYPFSHDLFLLLDKILPLQPEAAQLRDALSILMPYAVEIRYPDDEFIPSIQDVEEARISATKVLKWLTYTLPGLFQDVSTEQYRLWD